MGDEQKVGYEELLASSKAAFEAVPDFTVAVEEEFALLDPETLELVNRFEERAAGGARHRARAASRRRADRLRGRGPHGPLRDLRRSGRAARRTPGAAPHARRPARIAPRRRRHASVEPVAGAADHRHAALPPKRRAAPLRRLAQQHFRPACARRDQRRRPRDPRHAARCATTCRSCSRSPRARRSSRASSRPALGAHAALHAHVPALRHPRRFEGWDDWEQYVRFLYETGSITEHTQIWWSVRPHLVFPTVEIRICDAQPDLAEARSLAALAYSLTARIARALDEGEPLPCCRTA